MKSMLSSNETNRSVISVYEDDAYRLEVYDTGTVSFDRKTDDFNIIFVSFWMIWLRLLFNIKYIWMHYRVVFNMVLQCNQIFAKNK